MSTLLQASDAYSLGILLYEILCGTHAWGGLHSSQIFYAVVERKELPQWPPNVSPELKSIADRLLQYQAESRCSIQEAVTLAEGQRQTPNGHGSHKE